MSSKKNKLNISTFYYKCRLLSAYNQNGYKLFFFLINQWEFILFSLKNNNDISIIMNDDTVGDLMMIFEHQLSEY